MKRRDSRSSRNRRTPPSKRLRTFATAGQPSPFAARLAETLSGNVAFDAGKTGDGKRGVVVPFMD